jgi:iron complex transport system ATP-binding protein
MIQLKELEIGYKSKGKNISVFKNLNAEFKAGDLVGLIGDNGIGKSTLLKTITGNLTSLSGEVYLKSKRIGDYTMQDLSHILSIVITERVGGFNLTVWDLVAAGRTPYINVFGKLSKEDEQIINDSLALLNLNSLKHKLIDELSDGQRQKVIIAKSLAQQTPVIILDEPTAFLDYTSKHHLFSTLKNLALEQKKLIIVSSHDLDIMKQYVTSTLEME